LKFLRFVHHQSRDPFLLLIIDKNEMKNPIQMIKQCLEADEPYFVLRGKDLCALPAIECYYEAVRDKVRDPRFIEEIEEIEEIMKDFRAFRDEQETHIPD